MSPDSFARMATTCPARRTRGARIQTIRGNSSFSTHIDEDGNIWGVGNASGAHLHAGDVDFSEDMPDGP